MRSHLIFQFKKKDKDFPQSIQNKSLNHWLTPKINVLSRKKIIEENYFTNVAKEVNIYNDEGIRKQGTGQNFYRYVK